MNKLPVTPAHDFILCEIIKENQRRIGSIHVPDNSTEQQPLARVLAVGPGKLTPFGARCPMSVAVGDLVRHLPPLGQMIVLGRTYIIMRDDHVVCKVDPDAEAAPAPLVQVPGVVLS